MLTDSEILDLVKKGTSFLKIVEEAVGKQASNIDQDVLTEHLKRISTLAKYEPVFPTAFMKSKIDVGDRVVPLKFRHLFPTIVLFENLLSPQECEEIITMATPLLEPSHVQYSLDSGTRHKSRSSESCYLSRGSNELIRRIDQRCALLMQEPIEHGESLQVVKYKVGGEYRTHYDAIQGDPNPRTATLLMYLNDVPQGGDTYFPGSRLSIKPRRGSGIYFNYLDREGRHDPQVLHGGAPVKAGEKWIVTKWVRKQPYLIPT